MELLFAICLLQKGFPSLPFCGSLSVPLFLCLLVSRSVVLKILNHFRAFFENRVRCVGLGESYAPFLFGC